MLIKLSLSYCSRLFLSNLINKNKNHKRETDFIVMIFRNVPGFMLQDKELGRHKNISRESLSIKEEDSKEVAD